MDLSITPGERKKLRIARIRVNEIHQHSIIEITDLLKVSKVRAMELFALSEFQSLPSIGVRFAHDLISMGYYSLKQLKGKDGAKLTDQYEMQRGVWIDPCVEDQFRLVVHYARHPDSHKNWWDFTAERKAYRLANGYPSSRPKEAWHQLPQYRSENFLSAKKNSTKDDIQRKLRKALTFMSKNIAGKISLIEMSEASHLSPYHFSRCFKKVYEKTPLEYLTHLRLKTACKLLTDTQLPVNNICTKCGFENESSFGRLFKKNFQVTPVEFRNARRK